MTAYPSFISQRVPACGVRAETQGARSEAERALGDLGSRHYTQRSREHFSQDARQLLFNYTASTSNPKGCELIATVMRASTNGASGDATGNNTAGGASGVA